MKKAIIIAVCSTALVGSGVYGYITNNNSPPKTPLPDTTISQGTITPTVVERTMTLNLYFPTSDNSAIQKQATEVVVADGAVIKSAVLALMAGPKDKEHRKPIPEGTMLLSVDKKDTLVILNFSKEFERVDGLSEITEHVSLANTLTDIAGVQKVKVLIDGKDLIGPSGMPVGEMSRVALDASGKPIPGELKTMALYFSDSNADGVVAEKRTVYINNGEPLEGTIFEELAKGTTTKGLYNTIPKGTKLLSVKTENGTCTLNLSSEFVDNHPGGSTGEMLTLNSIVDSLTELPTVKRVQFLINGTKRDYYIHAIFDVPFTRDEKTIKK